MCRKTRFRPGGTLRKVWAHFAETGWSWGYCCPMGSIDTTVYRTTTPSSAWLFATVRPTRRHAWA
ncbi:MAG TPA: hypothetical protein DEA80_24995 [Afipia sp.]|nr:hypothetical protein [Afipia sp.]OUX59488.1 MAG: hypothetical protein CBB64_19385 [Afipia sp. TMED4]HAO43849.1 hypothetical protein [Afipia sp.]HAP10837.1 hypothetical protein [Afipia sp.]HAP49196.1 hypothetical protein [Afipia sp.]